MGAAGTDTCPSPTCMKHDGSDLLASHPDENCGRFAFTVTLRAVSALMSVPSQHRPVLENRIERYIVRSHPPLCRNYANYYAHYLPSTYPTRRCTSIDVRHLRTETALPLKISIWSDRLHFSRPQMQCCCWFLQQTTSKGLHSVPSQASCVHCASKKAEIWPVFIPAFNFTRSPRLPGIHLMYDERCHDGFKTTS